MSPDTTAEVASHRWWILLGLIMAAALEILDTTVVNVSLPQMAGNLGASTDEIAWVSTGYILSNVIVLPMTAWLSGRFGRKRYLMASIIIFNIARFMCGLSGSLGEIVFWRLIQGAGGAALYSLMRQLGGSFGIAVLNTYIVKMTAFHRSNLASDLFVGSTNLQDRIAGITGKFIGNGYSPTAAHSAALGVIDHTLQAQASTMAYNNAFILLGLSFLFALPAVLMLRKPRRGAAPAAEAH